METTRQQTPEQPTPKTVSLKVRKLAKLETTTIRVLDMG